MPKSPRRLELRLPYNHPVWDLPEGSRSKIVREWLEIGRRLSTIEDDLRDIKKLVSSEAKNTVDKKTIVTEEKKVFEKFDKNAFLNHFK